jgi:DNA polymerase-1
VQITYAPGQAVVCPVDPVYWPEWVERPRGLRRLLAQLKTILEDPTIRKVGHNLKFDIHMLRKLGIELANWSDDTQLKAFAVDENMMEKSLDECVRRWVEPMSGYADLFNQKTDKSKMREVPRDDMLKYAGGDTDATFRLDDILTDLLSRDAQQERIYQTVQMPAMRTFADTVERHGMLIDQPRLQEFGDEVRAWLTQAFPALIASVPAPVRRKLIWKLAKN